MSDASVPAPPHRSDLAYALYEQSGDALFLIDPVTTHCVDANSAASRLSGFARQELVGMSTEDLFRHKRAGGCSGLRQAVHRAEQPHDLQGFLLNRRGQNEYGEHEGWLPVNLTVTRLHLQPVLSLVSVRDDHDQRATLAKVHELEAEWRRVLASVSDALWSAEVDADGRWEYRYISPVVEIISGRPPEYFLGSAERWIELIHPDDRAKVQSVLKEVVATRTRMVYEYRLGQPDGSFRWVRSSVCPSPGPLAVRLDGVVSDISDRKVAEEALRRSEERFRTLVEKSTDVISLVDASGIIRYTTPASERITGRPPRDMIGQSVFELAHPEERAPLGDLFASCLTEPNRDVRFECRYLHGAGSWRHAEGTARNRLDDPDVRAVVVNFRDVTERKEAESRHRELIEHAPIAIYEEDFSAVGAWMAELRGRGVADLRTYLADRPEEVERAIHLIAVLDANRAAVEQVGAADKAELLAALPQLFFDFARAGITQELVTVWEGRDDFEFESRAKRLDGRPLDVIVRLHVPQRDGRPDLARVIVTCTDITARRRAEEARDREHVLLQAVLNAIPDCISYKDAKGVYQGCNSAFASFLGVTEGEVVGRTPGDLFPAEVVDKVAGVEARLNAGGPAERMELWLPAADRRQVLYESLGVPLPCPDGGRPGLIAISRDITARRNLEDQLRQAGKLEAVGQLAGGVAHDFNNLLTAVLGNLSLAQSMLPADHLTRPLLSASEQAAWRAAELTRQLLGFARRGTVRLEPADINASVAETLAILRRTIDPRITIVERTDPRLAPALADLGQVSQVLMNLCLNARDAMPTAGTMMIETANTIVDAAHARRVATARPGQFVRLSVSDTGEGIAQAIQDRIFEPFFTTKGPGKGTGLGLALVHGIVSQHRGWIEVDSRPGRGTRFDVYLPATSVPCSASAETERCVEPEALCPVPQSGTILVADDEPLILTLARAILEEHGYRVLLAADGREGVEVFRRERDRIDLVILDLSMPRLNGRDACRELTRIDPNIRILLSSGYAEDTDGATRAPGVRGFVPKPYRPAELAAAVRAALNGK